MIVLFPPHSFSATKIDGSDEWDDSKNARYATNFNYIAITYAPLACSLLVLNDIRNNPEKYSHSDVFFAGGALVASSLYAIRDAIHYFLSEQIIASFDVEHHSCGELLTICDNYISQKFPDYGIDTSKFEGLSDREADELNSFKSTIEVRAKFMSYYLIAQVEHWSLGSKSASTGSFDFKIPLKKNCK